jgi:hypothetical protein
MDIPAATRLSPNQRVDFGRVFTGLLDRRASVGEPPDLVPNNLSFPLDYRQIAVLILEGS